MYSMYTVYSCIILGHSFCPLALVHVDSSFVQPRSEPSFIVPVFPLRSDRSTTGLLSTVQDANGLSSMTQPRHISRGHLRRVSGMCPLSPIISEICPADRKLRVITFHNHLPTIRSFLFSRQLKCLKLVNIYPSLFCTLEV